MSTYKELVYLVLDELKLSSDDSFFTEDHVIFLLNKYRAFILKQKYADVRKQIPDSNYSTVEVKLTVKPFDPSIGGLHLKSSDKIPDLINVGAPSIHPENYFCDSVSLISKNRMRYVGHNKYMQNIIYATLGPDNYLYLKSSNPQFKHLEKVYMTGVFESPTELLSGDDDIMEVKFPLEEALIPPMIELVVKELSNSVMRPEDSINNATDDTGNLMNFARNASKQK